VTWQSTTNELGKKELVTRISRFDLVESVVRQRYVTTERDGYGSVTATSVTAIRERDGWG
jgi:hypothetical protein